MKALIAKKLGMSQVFAEDGKMSAVTLLEAGPCVVTHVRTKEKDGYNAIQLGFGEDGKIGKSQAGHLKPAKTKSKKLAEFRLDDLKEEQQVEFKVGDTLDVKQFDTGDLVTVSGVSKGKGFAGTIKRHGHHRGPKTHGSGSYRRIGSIGGMYPQKVWKGKTMPGRMGADTVTLHKIQISQVDPEANLLAVKGPVPGPSKGYVLVRSK